MKKSKIPPLGVRPSFVFKLQCEEQRIIELQEAICRFIKANRPIPDAIIKEYNELTNNLEIEDYE